MKIISKFKDYYDYLQGIYGIDEKLVLNRTTYTYISRFTDGKLMINEYDKCTLFITDLKIQGIYIQGEWRYGEEILNFLENVKTYNQDDDTYSLRIPKYAKNWNRFSSNTITILKYPVVDVLHHNDYYKCPILLIKGYHKNTDKKYLCNLNPILKEYNIQKIFTSEQIWILLSNWLSKVKEIPNTQTNKEKILSAGFDLKSSFRNIK